MLEKIAERHAGGLARGTECGSDFIWPRHVMTHDNTGALMPNFKQIGGTITR
jgi:homoaconitate hydratase